MEYYAPRSVGDALSIMARFAEEASVIAGGTDLVVDMKFRGWRPVCLVNINRIKELNYHREEADGLRIGPLATMRTLETSPLLKTKFTAIAEAAHHVGSVQIRYRATVGGNVCRASPAAEMSPALLVLKAQAVLASESGERIVDLQQFFLGPRRTVMTGNEILKEFRVDPLPQRSGSNYLRLGHRGALDLAIVSASSFVCLEPGDGIIKDVRIALGAVAPTPIRAPRTEALLRGQRLTKELLAEAGRMAVDEAQPITDVRSTAEYRKAIIAVLTRRSLQSSYHAAKNSPGDVDQ